MIWVELVADRAWVELVMLADVLLALVTADITYDDKTTTTIISQPHQHMTTLQHLAQQQQAAPRPSTQLHQ